MVILYTLLGSCSSTGSSHYTKVAAFPQLWPYPKKQHLKFCWNRRFLLVPQDNCRRNIVAAMDKLKFNIHSNDSEATEPARLLLEKFFAQTQKLEEKMSKDSGPIHVFELDINLEKLESDLNAALSALRRKEEDLEHAEQKLVLDRAELNRAKRDLDLREEEIVAAHAKQKEMEEDLEKETNRLASRAHKIESLKALVKEQGRKIADLQSTVAYSEEELNRLRRELALKSDEVSRMRSEIQSKHELLNEANGIITEQRVEIETLQIEIREKEENLYNLMHLRKAEQERLFIAEANLETRTLEWVAVREELEKLAEQAANNNINDVKGTYEDFGRVKSLLSDVRSELVASRESLSFYRTKFESQTIQLEKQFEEIEDEKLQVSSYRNSLTDAQQEVEVERTKLRTVEAQKDQLELQLSSEKELVVCLQQELSNERAHLRQATEEIDSLRQNLYLKELEFRDALDLLHVKETELEEASLVICNLKSEKAHLKTILEEKDRELVSTQKLLTSVNHEILEYNAMLKSREDQLVQSTARMQEKEKFVLAMQSELDNTRLKFSEASALIQRIAQLTDKLVISIENKDTALKQCDKENMSREIGVLNYGLQKQLPIDTKTTTTLLTKRIGDDEWKVVLESLEAKEKEIDKLKALLNDSNGTKKLYTPQLEVEAATNALSQVVDMSGQLLKQGQGSAGVVSGVTSALRNVETNNISITGTDWNHVHLEQAKKEVAHLLSLTQRLLEDATSTR